MQILAIRSQCCEPRSSASLYKLDNPQPLLLLKFLRFIFHLYKLIFARQSLERHFRIMASDPVLRNYKHGGWLVTFKGSGPEHVWIFPQVTGNGIYVMCRPFSHNPLTLSKLRKVLEVLENVMLLMTAKHTYAMNPTHKRDRQWCKAGSPNGLGKFQKFIAVLMPQFLQFCLYKIQCISSAGYLKNFIFWGEGWVGRGTHLWSCFTKWCRATFHK